MSNWSIWDSKRNRTLTTIGTATYGTSTYNLIYEGGLGQKGLIWLDYTNAGDTWSNQMSWADGLNNELTYTLRTGITVSWLGGWRLPSVNEMEHLYYHSLGNSDDLNQPINTGPFHRLLTGDSTPYWAGDKSPPNIYLFTPKGSLLGSQTGAGDWSALAVRGGQVGTATVPEPSTLLLFGSGLVGLGGVAWRRNGKNNACTQPHPTTYRGHLC